MNAALKICQAEYDAQLPPPVSDGPAETEWLEHAAEQLVCGQDVAWKRRFGSPGVVTSDDFCTYLQGHLNQIQIDGLDSRDSFARLVLAVLVGSHSEARTHAANLLCKQHPIEAVEDIAKDMLRPYAADAVAAEIENQEDDADGDL